MPQHISKDTLLVVSDTLISGGTEVNNGYGPVVRELEMLAPLFHRIIWIGCKAKAVDSTMIEISATNIKVVLLPSLRKKSLNAFLALMSYPIILFQLLKCLPKTKFVHTRCPSHPAMLAAIISLFDKRRQYWHKYAGSWIAETLPFTYSLQRKLLRGVASANRKVTENGNWNEGNRNIIPFENPCMYEGEIEQARRMEICKDYTRGLTLLFVGNLDDNKGILPLLDALVDTSLSIRKLIIVGTGPLEEQVKLKCKAISNIEIEIKGQLSKASLQELYKQAHFLVVPSASEGFPKVIAEAALWYCITVATSVSCIPQYIHNGHNGFLMADNKAETIAATLSRITEDKNLKQIADEAFKMCPLFTYEYFKERIMNEVFILND